MEMPFVRTYVDHITRLQHMARPTPCADPSPARHPVEELAPDDHLARVVAAQARLVVGEPEVFGVRDVGINLIGAAGDRDGLTGSDQHDLVGEPPCGGQARSALRVERPYGSFSRTLHLPAPVDERKVSARLRRGVLEVVLPRSSDARVHSIKVQVRS